MTFVNNTLHLSIKLYTSTMKDLNTKRQSERQLALKKLSIWTISWVASQALVIFGSLLLWPESNLLKIASLSINVLLGIQMILANRHLFKKLDELERLLQLEALAWTLGLTLVIGLAYSSLDIINLIPFDAEISYLVMFMGITYFISLTINKKRYE